MSTSIDQTLSIIVKWFEESADGEQVQLLSKLALLELCGWLEGTFDDLIIQIGGQTVIEKAWIDARVISPIHGFHYEKHLRRMLQGLLGEVIVRRVEERLDLTSPSDFSAFKALLSTLWTIRCNLAHADIVSNIKTQKTLKAPSWSRSQYGALNGLITIYQKHLQAEIDLLCVRGSMVQSEPSLTAPNQIHGERA